MSGYGFASCWLERLGDSERAKKKRVLLVIYTHPEWHSSLVFSSQILCELGYEVDIVCKHTDQRSYLGPVDFGAGVRVHAISSGTSWSRTRLDYLIFLLAVAWITVVRRPRWAFGYDLFGFVAVCLASPGTRRVYHNFDLAEGHSRTMRALRTVERIGARRAAFVVASSETRAHALARQLNLRQMPLTLMNCQRLHVKEERTGELLRLLRQHEVPADRIVVRLGSLDPGHGIEATIRSVAHWKCSRWCLVLAGGGSAAFLTEMRGLVELLGLQSRVLFLPHVARRLWYDCLLSADLGIALYESGNINHLSMAGAGNKLNLYLKAGIPSIVSALPDFQAFAHQFGACEVAAPTDPNSIAGAINSVLRDHERYGCLCREATRAFETRFNFEAQFEPILLRVARLDAGRDKGGERREPTI